MDLIRTKPITDVTDEFPHLRRALGAWDLTLLGIGAIIGAGVFVLTGIAAATKAGPAISVSYIVSGLATLFSALAYAELAASIGQSGSAYAYSYVAFGEFIAWIIGWDLLFEYTLSVATVSIGWSGYVNNGLQALGLQLPIRLTKNPFEGGIINLPAVLIILTLATLLSVGVKHSSRFNAVIVFIKLMAILVFIVVASQNIEPSNWNNFFPFGWSGVMNGAAIVFFAYIGFDAVSTAAEEAINPQRDLPISIILSVLICTTIYVVVAVLLTGIVPYTVLNVPSPVADALLKIGHPVAAGFISAGAIAGLTTVMLVMYYGLTRVCYAISRDGLLPYAFARIHPKTKTPVLTIMSSGIVIALLGGLLPLHDAAELVNIGTLAAFTLVNIGIIVLRTTRPDLPRPFRLPFNPIVPLLGMGFCFYLMLHLPFVTWMRFVVWMAIGLLVYFFYSQKHSRLNPKK